MIDAIQDVSPIDAQGFHGYYDGYSLDVMIDADSELITMLDVLPANGAEARSAIDLIRREEQTHGNDVEALSIDGIGFNGEVLRELTDPDDLAIEVIVPPTDFQQSKGFASSHRRVAAVRCYRSVIGQ